MITYSPAIIARAIAQATSISLMFEGCELVAYPDPGTGAEPWTIGRGSTEIDGRPVRPGDTCTETQADAWMQQDLRASFNVVIHALTVELNGDQLGALTSFVNNVGPGEAGVKDGFIWLANGEHSTMLTLIEAGNFTAAAGQFQLWNRGGGRPMRGLTRRRSVERSVFLGQLDMRSEISPN